MSYQVEQSDGYSILHLEGDVDLSRSPEARKLILACLQRGHNLLVDLSGVSYIDSSGIASLVEGYQLSRKLELEFGLLGVSESALNVLKLARLDQVFPIHNSLDECLKEQGSSG